MRERPLTRILGFGVDDRAARGRRLRRGGACGLMFRCTASIADLVGAVRRVARGDTVCSVAMADGLFQHLRGVALGGFEPSVPRWKPEIPC